MPTITTVSIKFCCRDCDYQSTSSTDKGIKLIQRLHAKKCKKEGREFKAPTPAEEQANLAKKHGFQAKKTNKMVEKGLTAEGDGIYVVQHGNIRAKKNKLKEVMRKRVRAGYVDGVEVEDIKEA